MAISQTMSNPNDWLFQPYQNDFSHINPNIHTSPTTTTFSAAAATAAAARANGSSHLSPEQGRVAKPTRRRSRASRRTPTTLLNTDTANFRAMVQHFTGGPAAAAPSSVSFATSRSGAAASAGGGGGYMSHAAGGFHVQYPNQLQQQHVFVMENGGGGAAPQTAAVSGNRISYDNFMV